MGFSVQECFRKILDDSSNRDPELGVNLYYTISHPFNLTTAVIAADHPMTKNDKPVEIANAQNINAQN